MRDYGQGIKLVNSVDHQLITISSNMDLIFNRFAGISGSSVQLAMKDNSSLVFDNVVETGVSHFFMEGTPSTDSLGIRQLIAASISPRNSLGTPREAGAG